MKYAVNQIVLLKSGIIGTVCKTELVDAKGYYTVSLGNDNNKVVRTGDIKCVVGNVLSEIPGRSKAELTKYFAGKKASVKELKKFYELLAKAKIVEDIIDVDANINAKSELSFDKFAEWWQAGRIKEKSNLSINPYMGYVNIQINDKIRVKMLLSTMDEGALYPLFYQVNDMDVVSGPCVIDFSQEWTLTPMQERDARAFRNVISSFSDMIYLNESKCFIPKSVLPNNGDVVKMKNYTPDTLPGYLNAVNLYFSGKDIKVKCTSGDGSIVFTPTEKGLKRRDYYCLITDIETENLLEKSIKEPPTKPI